MPAYIGLLKFDIKMFVNVAMLDIDQSPGLQSIFIVRYFLKLRTEILA